MRVRVAIAAILALLSPAWLGAQPIEPSGFGRAITRVELRTDLTGRDLGATQEFLSVAIGETLTAEAVRNVLLSLQGTGVVAEAEIFTRLDGDGVAVTVAAWSRIVVESVSFEGDVKLPVDELTDLASLKVHGPFIESRVLRSVYRIQDLHEENGYLEHFVRPSVEIDERSKRARVTFEIDSGARATVGSIDFEGELATVDPSALQSAMESRPGGRYWPSRVGRDRDHLQRYLTNAGYRMASVGRPIESYDWDQHRMNLSFPIDIGPRVEVEVTGADLAALVDQGLLGFMGAGGYDTALVGFSVQRVRSWYQSEGYYQVDVQTSEEIAEDLIRLTMTVDPGPRYRLTRIRLTGNDTFEEETLRRLMATTERRAFTPGSGRLVDSVLAEDLARMRSYYVLQGFGAAAVGPGEVDLGDGEIALTVPIVEGPRRMVGEVTWTGVQTQRVRDLARGLAIQPAGPFHETLLEQSLNELRARYRDAGFDRALVSAELGWDDRHETADVAFQVLEGRQTILRRLLIRGQQVTSPWVLRRAIDLEPGDPVSQSKLMAIQRRLYDLGVFTSVDVRLAQGRLITGERDVVINLQEGDRHRLSVGGGYDTEDGLRLLFGYSLANLAGRAMSLDLDTVVSQREELYRLLLLQPATGGMWRYPMRYTLFATREEEPNISDAIRGDFVSEQIGVQASADVGFKAFKLPLLYTYKLVDNNATVSDELEEIFPREKAKVRISSVTAAIRVDRRNSPINASEGRNTVIQAEYAFPFFSAEEDFLKLFLQQTKYVDLHQLGIIGVSLRLGAIESFRDDIDETPGGGGSGCSSDAAPDFGVALSERFFAGGRTTHRAYELDSLGIVGETLFFTREEVEGTCQQGAAFATGGNGLALFNFDYRYSFMPGFWATAFYDTGNVWADWRDIAFEDFKDGVGVGVGWDSPIGPLRLEIGWKLDREEFEDPYEIFLSFGTAF